MDTIKVRLAERSYPIHIGSGLIGDRALLASTITADQVLLVSNDVVAPLYQSRLQQSLPDCQMEVLLLPDGEQHKSLATFAGIIDKLIAARFHRDACVIALGGGVVGDIAGYAAASYQRGIDFVQVPTTLLAQVDSSVGGKTAVNHPDAKNMIGAFHQPIAVLADTDTLKSLPDRELSAGIAEIIKYGLILDAQFFAWLEAHMDELLALDAEALNFAIRRSCEIKAAIVAEDEREHGRRALLNLGHTFGHALESLAGFGQWLHGEAVAVGIQLAAKTSVALGTLDAQHCGRIEALLRRARLPVSASGIAAQDLLEQMRLDKKAGKHGLKLVLLEDIGTAVVRAAPEQRMLAEILGAELAA